MQERKQPTRFVRLYLKFIFALTLGVMVPPWYKILQPQACKN